VYSRLTAFAIALWLILLACVFAVPYWLHSPTLDDDLTRRTVRVSLLYYAAAMGLVFAFGDRFKESPLIRLMRLLWTLAWAGYVIHLATAFGYYHHWSHQDAFEHTREVSGVGEGIYVSHFFTLIWTLDVLAWWLSPAARATRSPWIGRLLYAFMAFIVFNGTVVYETGMIRWAGVAMFVMFGVAYWFGRRRRMVEAEKRSG
jgi:hypothetical protein